MIGQTKNIWLAWIWAIHIVIRGVWPWIRKAYSQASRQIAIIKVKSHSLLRASLRSSDTLRKTRPREWYAVVTVKILPANLKGQKTYSHRSPASQQRQAKVRSLVRVVLLA